MHIRSCYRHMCRSAGTKSTTLSCYSSCLISTFVQHKEITYLATWVQNVNILNCSVSSIKDYTLRHRKDSRPYSWWTFTGHTWNIAEIFFLHFTAVLFLWFNILPHQSSRTRLAINSIFTEYTRPVTNKVWFQQMQKYAMVLSFFKSLPCEGCLPKRPQVKTPRIGQLDPSNRAFLPSSQTYLSACRPVCLSVTNLRCPLL